MEHKPIYWSLLVCLFAACHSSPKNAIKPIETSAVVQQCADGLLPTSLHFSWKTSPVPQGSYQILVASSKALLKLDIGDIWDSDRRFGRDSTIEFSNNRLIASSKVWWKIRLWTTEGLPGDFSPARDIKIPEGQAPVTIALIGGTMISEMENHGDLESALSRLFPNNGIILRNIGWPADDVFGQARSQFGSAQNTRSWEPPTAEEGFGSKVLSQHIIDAKPTVIMIGYGSDNAFNDDPEDMLLFESGYQRLLALTDSLQVKVILLAPPKQELVHTNELILNKRNEQLEKTRDFIREIASKQQRHFIDLFDQVITEPVKQQYTSDGIQLNALGYQKMSDVILASFNLQKPADFSVELDSNGWINSQSQVTITEWKSTVRGVQFQLSTNGLSSLGQFKINAPAALYVDGVLRTKGEGPFSISLSADSIQCVKLEQEISLKNRLHRYRLRPLNEAYIYLFRRHEMGHLAYEMDDFEQLVQEGESNIRDLLAPITHRIDIELIQPWQPPKNYPEDEVPAFIPEPNIAEELRSFKVPEGFEINLFAADPMIANPINMNWDTRGRAWVATSSTYPHIVPGREPNDRIVILEDTDQDGKADKSTVFAEGLFVPHSVMPVPGGAYVTATTQFLFLADTNGDDIADTRQVVFDGFGNADVHHMIHGLRWAPWGDLFFTQSIYINTFVETPYGHRRLNGSGTWSFRPETGRLEIFSRGLINPWGQALDEWGQSFATDGAGSSGINYLFPESAHATAVGADRIINGLNSGTPKNTGAEVVYSRHLPNSWQGSILTSDFRANRTVRYAIQPQSSGYQAEEVETILQSSHRSYRPVDMKIGPDGAIYIVDWYNPIIDHGEVDFHHPVRDKTHGRIWRLTYKNKPLVPKANIYGASISELLDHLKSPEQYTRMQANRELVARHCAPQMLTNWVHDLRQSDPDYDQHRLEALWLGAALNFYDDELLNSLLVASNPKVRAAAVRMVMHWGQQQQKLEMLADLIHDAHPQVRLETIHALRTLGILRSAELTLQALDQPLDENLDFAIWLTIKNLKKVWLPAFRSGQTDFGGDINKQMYALIACNDAEVNSLMTALIKRPELSDTLVVQAWHSLARLGDGETLSMVLHKAATESDITLLRAMAKAPKSNVSVPTDDSVLLDLLQNDSSDIRIAASELVGRWHFSEAANTLINQAKNPDASTSERLAACRAMIRIDQLEVVKKLAKSPNELAIRTTACAAWIEEEPENAVKSATDLLQSLDDLKDAELLFLTYRKLEDGPAIITRALSGIKLSEPIASAGLRVAQTSGLDLSEMEKALREAGSLTPIGIEMSSDEKKQLLADAVTSGNGSRGYSIYRRPQMLCATCHQIKGIGGLIGPDLTTVGSYMTPNSILESILNPSSDIKQGYETVIVTKTDGEVLSGTLYRKTDSATLLRQANGEILSIPAAEITKVDVSPVSLMPQGLTASLHRDELRDLIYYLTHLGVPQSL